MPLEVDLKVESADAAAIRFQEAGGKVSCRLLTSRSGGRRWSRTRGATSSCSWIPARELLTDAEGHVIGVVRAADCCGGYDELYEEALRLAARAHRSQTRKGTDLPYIAHPVHVSAILQRYGFPREAVIAALLHDVVEDQDVTVAEIEAQFGAAVAEIVDALSERRKDGQGEVRPWHVRKAEAVEQIRQASAAAAAVKAADVLHNAQSILYDLRHDGPGVWQRFTRGPEQMLGYYGRIAALVQAKLGDHPLVRELLAVLVELSAGGRALERWRDAGPR